MRTRLFYIDILLSNPLKLIPVIELGINSCGYFDNTIIVDDNGSIHIIRGMSLLDYSTFYFNYNDNIYDNIVKQLLDEKEKYLSSIKL